MSSDLSAKDKDSYLSNLGQSVHKGICQLIDERLIANTISRSQDLI